MGFGIFSLFYITDMSLLSLISNYGLSRKKDARFTLFINAFVKPYVQGNTESVISL